MKTPPRSRPQAFSLIELITVISVIAVLATFTVPALNTVLKGSYLNQGANLLISQLNLARQQAITRNRQVEVRFYRFADPETPGEDVNTPASGAFRALQVFEVRDSIVVPIDKIQRLPGPVIFSYTEATNGFSSLIDGKTYLKQGSTGGTNPRLPRVDYKYEYVALRFLPDGSTDRSAIGNWYITVVEANAKAETAGKPPANFFTVQLDPVSGALRNYRPNAG